MLNADVVHHLPRPLDVRIGVAVAADAEGRIGRRTNFIFLSNIVAVQVSPRSDITRRNARVVRVREAGRFLLGVFADTSFDRGPAVATELEGHAEARADV